MLAKRKFDAAVTLIASGTVIAGDLHFAHQLYLNGRLTGDVKATEGDDATIVISETGRVTGDIRVPNVVISGHVEGNVVASGRVELAATARVRGDVHYRQMEMRLGATVDGRMLHLDVESATRVTQLIGDLAAALPAVPPVATGMSAIGDT